MVLIDPSMTRRGFLTLQQSGRRRVEVLETERQALGVVLAVILVCTDRHCPAIQRVSEQAGERLENYELERDFLVELLGFPNDALLAELRLDHNLVDLHDRLKRCVPEVPRVLELPYIVVGLQAPLSALTPLGRSVQHKRYNLVLVSNVQLHVRKLVTIFAVVDCDDLHSLFPLLSQYVAIVNIRTVFDIIATKHGIHLAAVDYEAIRSRARSLFLLFRHYKSRLFCNYLLSFALAISHFLF